MGVEIIESRKEDFKFLDFRKKKKKTINGIIASYLPIHIHWPTYREQVRV